MRRLVLAGLALGILLMWSIVPYGKREDSAAQTFAATALGAAMDASPRIVARSSSSMGERAALLTLVVALFVPLYPALLAARLSIAPSGLRFRRRWVWFVEGALLLLLSRASWFSASFALSDFNWGAPAPPRLCLALWLLPGLAALAGIVGIVIGIAPHGRIARLVLG